MLATFLWCAALYVVVGVIVTIFLSQTPYSVNPWPVTIALWPLFLFA